MELRQKDCTQAAYNIISAIVESNIMDSNDYALPYNSGNTLQYIHARFHRKDNKPYHIRFTENSVGVILSIRAINYKGIKGKIEKLQSLLKEEITILTGYEVSFIHIKLV